jgi:hypothetical protein
VRPGREQPTGHADSGTTRERFGIDDMSRAFVAAVFPRRRLQHDIGP